MKLKPIYITHADAQILESAILIIERVANIADHNADFEPDDDTDTNEIPEMCREIANTADTACTAIDDLLYAIKSYDVAGYNDAADDE